ncbi:cadmium-translocating P-type ATPase [Lachnospiraceae bacterium]|jgi:Cd2+/Zn2+-exporting ATPase|nr:heavy metal translocating P-type ATPase [uncultured Schaedlerella sp.]MCI9153847.1 cadmium-translocating P-type ATPase [Ruminococcus sp.]NBI58382.1 cadmium-translocating P-type ATPase [Lachnospiraceae bacterium]
MSKEIKIRLIEFAVGFAAYLGLLIGRQYDYWNLAVTEEMEPILFIAAYGVLAADACWQVLKRLRHLQFFDENLLMLLATGGAMYMGKYTEAAAVILIFHIGKLIEAQTLDHTKRSIAKFMDIRPAFANRKRGLGEETVSPEELRIGQIIVIRPGEKIPVDAVVMRGFGNIDEKALTGEFQPRSVSMGSRIYSGSINMDGVLDARVTKVYEDSTAAKILSMVEEAMSNKGESQSLAERFIRLYSPIVTILGILVIFLAPTLFPGQDPETWIYRGLIFLVAACPCGLLVSVSVAFLGGIGAASRQGVLIKSGSYLEDLSQTEIFIFDKTGTLTEGTFGLKEICPRGITAAQLLEITAYAEAYSSHPIALSLRDAYEKGIDTSRLGYIQERPGLGIEAVLDGIRVYTGNARFMEVLGIQIQKVKGSGTAVHAAVGRRYVGYVLISDRVRGDVSDTIRWLRQQRMEVMMLTGDNEHVANDVAKTLGIEYVYANLMPQDKVTQLEEIMNDQLGTEKLAFVGDGINDAPVLARADIGIAMGGLGSDAALEAADIILMEDEPFRIINAIRISRGTVRTVRENLYFSLFIKAVLLGLAFFGGVTMGQAVIADVAVLAISLLNSFWVLKFPE